MPLLCDDVWYPRVCTVCYTEILATGSGSGFVYNQVCTYILKYVLRFVARCLPGLVCVCLSFQERTRLWVAVSKAEANAVKLERQGEVEEAAELRAHAKSMRYEDPYTALQDQLDEAVKNEVITFFLFMVRTAVQQSLFL